MITLVTLLIAAPTIIDNVRIESGAGPIEHATVIIDQGKIVQVGTKPATTPQGTHIDGTGKVLTAGFIETLSNVGIDEVGLEPSTVDSAIKDEPLAPAARLGDAFNPLSIRIPLARGGGITSIIVHPSSGILGGTAVWAELTGSLANRPDPTRPVAMIGDVSSESADSVGGSRTSLWLTLRQVFDDARLHRRSAGRPLERSISLSSMNLEALYPVIDGKLPLVLGADRASDILAAIDFAKAEKVRLVVAGGAEAWLVSKQLRESHVPVIVEPREQLPYGFDMLNARDDLATLLDHDGVSVILSTGLNDDPNPRRLRLEAGMAVALGMPREAALRAITTTPAEVFDRGASYGSIAVGKRADLVLWSGDPFEISTVAEHVWIEGNEMSLENRQHQLAQRYLHNHD
jgi:imidazolonepropionase-like amidohydrolase